MSLSLVLVPVKKSPLNLDNIDVEIEDVNNDNNEDKQPTWQLHPEDVLKTSLYGFISKAKKHSRDTDFCI